MTPRGLGRTLALFVAGTLLVGPLGTVSASANVIAPLSAAPILKATSPAPDKCAKHFEHGIGMACDLGNGQFRVDLPGGGSTVTHHDPVPEAASFLPHLPTPMVLPAERPLVCADTPEANEGYYIQLVYAVPTDKTNNYTADKPNILGMFASINGHLNAEAAEFGSTADFRVHCTSGTADLLNFSLSTTNAATTYVSVFTDLFNAGYSSPYAKYLVLTVGGGGCCQGGAAAQDATLALDNPNNFGPHLATAYVPPIPYSTDNQAWGVAFHELGHTLGAVSDRAPHNSGELHCLDSKDIMCTGPAAFDMPRAHVSSDTCTGTYPVLHFDCGHDDFFNTNPSSTNYLYDHWNIGSRLERFIRFGGAGNKSPEVSSASCYQDPSPVNKTATCLFTASDDGWGVYFTIAWGDGSPDTRIPATGYIRPGATGSASHTYTSAGLKAIGVTASDTDFPVATSSIAFYCQGVGSYTPIQPCPPLLAPAVPGNGSVQLSWVPLGNGGSAITGYNVYRGTLPNTEILYQTLGVVTSYADPAATNGIPYYYKVAAVNAVGIGALSSERTATPSAATVPGQPALYGGQPWSDVKLNFSAWRGDGGSAITQWKVYRRTPPASEGLLTTLSGAATEYTDATAIQGQDNYYRVRATNSAGDSPYSVEWFARRYSAPAAPGTVVASPGNAQVSLFWSAPADGGRPITGYNVYRGTTSGSLTLLACLRDAPIPPCVTTATTFTDTTASNDTTYYYQVSAIQGPTLEGAKSTVVSAAPAGSVSSAPTLSRAIGRNAKVTLEWTTPTTRPNTIQGYTIYRGTLSGGEAQIAGTVVQNSYTDTTASNGVPYYYKVGASNPAGVSSLSNELSTIGVNPSPPDISTVTPTFGNGQVSLSWTTPGNGGSTITNYKVYRTTNSDGVGTFVITLPVQNSWTDTGRTNGTKYYYQVTAVNAIGEGPRSATVASTPATLPGTVTLPVPVVLNAGGDNRVALLNWTPPSDGGSAITSYKVYRGASGGEIYLGSSPAPTYSDIFTKGTTYYYKVSAVNGVGESAALSNERNVPLVPDGLGSKVYADAFSGLAVVHWLPPAGDGGSAITGYKIYRGSTGPGSEAYFATAAAGATTYADAAVSNGTTYYYQVTATNIVGESLTRSSEVSAKPGSIPSSGTITTQGGYRKTKLIWTTPYDGGSAITNYKIYRGATSFGETLLTTVGVQNSYVDTTALTGTYFYMVVAVNVNGEGLRDAEISATVASPASPALPWDPALAASGGGTQVTLTITAPHDAGRSITKYKIYRSTSTGTETFLTNLGANATSFVDTAVTGGTPYYYKVSAVNAVGEGPLSAESSATA